MTDRANSPANHAARAFGLAANQFEGAEASRIVPAIHPIAANLTVGVVCLKGCCGDSLSIDGPAPALVMSDKLSPASAHRSALPIRLVLDDFQFRQAR
jgi:hypothetical protein